MFSRRTFLQSAMLLPLAFAQTAYAQDATQGASTARATLAEEVFADFEGGSYAGWTVEGNAFGSAPATDALFPGQITGFSGRGFLCSLHPQKGNAATGRAISREFTIEKPLITFKIGGGDHPGEACMNLVVDNQIVASATGNDTPVLSDAWWNVAGFLGRKAHLEVVDRTTSTQRGYIIVDDIRFTTGTINTDTMDAFIQERMETLHIPAISLAVMRGGCPLLMKAYGFADRENNIRAAIDTPFLIASVSKQFFAAAILILVQDGKVSLDDFASKYLQGPPASWSAITLRHLLSHTSGLMREAPGFRWNKRQADADVIGSAYARPLEFAPGEKFQYSNLGYFAVAEIIRVVSGTAWSQFIQDRIFVPSAMTKTGTTADPRADCAAGYSYRDRNGEKLKGSDYTALRPSGAFVSTVRDMARWDAMLLKDTILTPESRRLLWTPATLNNHKRTSYGLGWELTTVHGSRRAFHNGQDPGYNSMFIHGIDDGVSVLLLENSDKAEPDAIGNRIALMPSPL